MDDDGTTGGTEGGEYGYCQCSWRSFCWQHNVDCWPCTSVWSAGFQAGTAAAAEEEAEKDARAQALIWDEWEQEWETEEKKAAKKAEKKAAKKAEKEAKKKSSAGSPGGCEAEALLDHQWDRQVQKTKGCNAEVKRAKC